MSRKAMNGRELVYAMLVSCEGSVTAEAQRAAIERYAQLHGFTIMLCGSPEAFNRGTPFGGSAASKEEASDQ